MRWRLFLLVSAVTGFAIIGGSVVGAALGWLKAGACAGGVSGVLLAVWTAGRLRVIPVQARWPAALGGIIGLAAAAGMFLLAGPQARLPAALGSVLEPLFDTPLGPALTGLLVPIGALIGARTQMRPTTRLR